MRDLWNATQEIGQVVSCRRNSGNQVLTASRSLAFLAQNGRAVIFLEGIAGYYLLERVMPMGQAKKNVCRACGCTPENCSGCVQRTGKPCSWVDRGKSLCSACAGHAFLAADGTVDRLEVTSLKEGGN